MSKKRFSAHRHRGAMSAVPGAPAIKRSKSRKVKTLAGIASICAVLCGSLITGTGRDSGKGANSDTPLVDAVKMLNISVADFVENGGAVSSGLSGDEVLNKLKMKIGNGVIPAGPFIDANLKGQAADPHVASPRIVWEPNQKQFLLAERGAGWSRLYPEAQEAPVIPASPPAGPAKIQSNQENRGAPSAPRGLRVR